MIRSITRGYLDAELTAYINWPLIAAIYPNLPYDTDGLILANQPWSGAYSVGERVGHRPGHPVHRARLAVPRLRLRLPGRHRVQRQLRLAQVGPRRRLYHRPRDHHATAAQTVTFTVSGGLSTGAVHVWSTNLNSPDQAATSSTTRLTPASGTYPLTLQPGYVYTVTTTTGQGKGTAASPAKATLALPYSDAFDGSTGSARRSTCRRDEGSFEIEPCAGGRSGQCVQQQRRSSRSNGTTPSNRTALGDMSWANYTVSADALMTQAGTVQLFGRVNTQDPSQPEQSTSSSCDWPTPARGRS